MIKLLILLTVLLQNPVFSCPTKKKAIECFYSKADLNHDNQIDKDELSKAIDEYLPWYESWPFHMFGGIDRILKDCDANHDGILTAKEAYFMQKTCLETCYKRSMSISTFEC